MVPAGNPVLFILAAIFVAMVALFGMFVLFVRAENIERNVLVGGLTLLTAVIAAVMLWEMPATSHTGPILVSVGLMSLFGYVIGRVLDYFLGPVEETSDIAQPTLGADLSD